MRKDYTGQKFHFLTALRFDYMSKSGHQFWLFRCDCGNEKVLAVSHVKKERGGTMSCGCYQRKCAKEQQLRYFKTHGMNGTKFYNVYCSVFQRCNNPNNSRYKDYGGRNVKLLWNKFEDFRDDMYEGYLEHIEKFGKKDTSIDRIDNNGNYCKENCKWSTPKEQMRNTRRNTIFTINNEKKCLIEWAEKYNVNYHLVITRLCSGWSIERALTTK